MIYQTSADIVVRFEMQILRTTMQIYVMKLYSEFIEDNIIIRDVCHKDEEFFNMSSDFQYESSDLTNFRDFFAVRFFEKAERFEINKI